MTSNYNIANEENVLNNKEAEERKYSSLFTVESMLLVFGIFFGVQYLHIVSSVIYSCNSNAACGCSTNAATVTRIVGGENAVSNSWGWAVSLFIDERILCGGTIISSSWIITAAHCVEGMEPYQVIVSAATNALYGLNQWRYSSSIIRHPQYSNHTFENDIALIKVSPPFNMSDPGIAKICLPMATEQDFPALNSTVFRFLSFIFLLV